MRCHTFISREKCGVCANTNPDIYQTSAQNIYLPLPIARMLVRVDTQLYRLWESRCVKMEKIILRAMFTNSNKAAIQSFPFPYHIQSVRSQIDEYHQMCVGACRELIIIINVSIKWIWYHWKRAISYAKPMYNTWCCCYCCCCCLWAHIFQPRLLTLNLFSIDWSVSHWIKWSQKKFIPTTLSIL